MSIKLWQTKEIILKAENSYENPYKEVDVWVDLEGPNFRKRVYGFWDGENIFKVRIIATSAGEWKWSSGSNQSDPGLNGKTRSFSGG